MWRRIAETILNGYLIIGGIFSLIVAFWAGSEAESVLVFLGMLLSMAATIFLSGMMLGMIVEALRYLEEIANNTKNLGTSMNTILKPQSVPQNAKDSKLDLSAVANASSRITSDSWICPKCDAKNPINAVFCKSCGEHK